MKLTGLWKKTYDGKTVLEGTLGFTTIRIYMNATKSSENSPDAMVYLAEKPKPGDPKGAKEGRSGHPYAPKATPKKMDFGGGDAGGEPSDFGF